ncbi:MAG: excisionase family DNA-binding protein [bacterium]
MEKSQRDYGQNNDEKYGRLLTVEAAAEKLSIRVSNVRRMIADHRIGAVRPTVRNVRIPESEVDRILSEGYTPATPCGS